MISRRRKLLIAAGLVLLIMGTGGVALVDKMLEAVLRDPINSYLRDRTLALLDEKSPSGLTISFPALDFKLTRRRLIIRDLKIRYDRSEHLGYVRLAATIPLIDIDGVDLSDVIWHKHLRLSSIQLTAPTLVRSEETQDSGKAVPTTEEDTVVVEVPALDTLIYHIVGSWLPPDLRDTQIDLVSADRAMLVSTVSRRGRMQKDSTTGLQLTIHGIRYDSTHVRVFDAAELHVASHLHLATGLRDSLRFGEVRVRIDSHDTLLTIREVRVTPSDNDPALFLHGLRQSYHERSFALDSLNYAPLQADAAYFRRGARLTRVRLVARGLTAKGVRTAGLVRQEAGAAQVSIDHLSLDILADRRTPDTKSRIRPRWPQRFAALGWTIALDSVVLREGSIRYGELLPERPDPASISFTRISLRGSNISNNDADTHAQAPAVVQATARVMDQARLAARFEIPITSHNFALGVEGTLGEMQVPVLNAFLLTSDGMRLTSGLVHEGNFRFRIDGGRARGQFDARYDSLKVQIVDQHTRKRGLGEKIKTFVANQMLLYSSNPENPGGSIRHAQIDYILRPEDTFWGACWRSVRSGIVALLKKSHDKGKQGAPDTKR